MLGNVHRHTVQCVLVINMFMEKIFIFLWLWILFLAFLSAVNLSAWLATLSIPFCRQAFVEKFLDFDTQHINKSTADIHDFVENFLRFLYLKTNYFLLYNIIDQMAYFY